MRPRRIKPSEPPPATSAAEVSPALDWAVSHGVVDEVFSRVAQRLRRRRRQRRAAAAAAVAGLVLAATVIWRGAFVDGDRAAAAFPPAAVVVISPRTESLPDGTVVELNEGARLTVAFTEELRRVTLEHGEAHFQVAKNPSRPFIVTAGGVEVRAVGTAFAVQLGDKAVEVLVTEGRVAVEPSAPVPNESAPPVNHYASVDAGNRVEVELSAPPAPVPVVAVSQAELSERLDWRVPRIKLAGTPLARVLEVMNRHAAVRFVLADADLGSLELSGVIRADNADSLLRLLQAEFQVEAEPRADEIVLRWRR